MVNFSISHSPFIRDKNDTNKMFLYVAAALILNAIFAVITFGFRSLAIVAFGVGSCFLSECLYNLMTKKKFFVDDFSVVVTGLVLSLLMPINVPFYVVIISGFISSFVTKMAFGGLGKNNFNPALVGRCFAGMICSGLTAELYRFSSGNDVLMSLTEGGSYTLQQVLSGKIAGGIGATCAVLILACFIFLSVTRTIDFKITAVSVVAYLIVGLSIWNLETTIINICSGSFLFLSVFVMTDPNTSPDYLISKILCSAVFGALSPLIFSSKVLGENSVIVLALIVNLFVPIVDRLLGWKPIQLGGMRNAHKN